MIKYDNCKFYLLIFTTGLAKQTKVFPQVFRHYILTLGRPGGGQMDPHRFFGPKIWNFQAIEMTLLVPVVW